jgi:hypothetical protein
MPQLANVKNDFEQINNYALKIETITAKQNQSEIYQTRFNELLKSEASRQVEKGEVLDIDDFTQSKLALLSIYQNQNVTSNIDNPAKQAESDYQAFSNFQAKLFEIHQKAFRNDEYKKILSDILPDDKKHFLSKISDFLTKTEIEEHQNNFDKNFSSTYPKFELEPFAVKDFKNLVNIGNVELYEIGEKLKNPDYQKSFILLYQEQAEKLNMPNVENFAKNKMNTLQEQINSIPDDEKAEAKKIFDKKFPNGFKTQKELVKENIEEMKGAYDEFRDNLTLYLKIEQWNTDEQIKRTQYMQDVLSKEPEKFNTFSERFFSDGDIKNAIPNTDKLKRIGTSKRFKDVLTERVLFDTNRIIKNADTLGRVAKRSQDQLKEYRIKQFKRGHSEAVKKLQMTNKQGYKIDNREQSSFKLSKEM